MLGTLVNRRRFCRKLMHHSRLASRLFSDACNAACSKPGVVYKAVITARLKSVRDVLVVKNEESFPLTLNALHSVRYFYLAAKWRTKFQTM